MDHTIDAARPRLVFLCPLVHRPLLAGFASQFEYLSASYQGHVFAMSSSIHRGAPLGRFQLYTALQGTNSAQRLVAWARLQLILPLRLLRRRSVDAVMTYDPYASGLAGLVLSRALGTKLIVEFNGEYHTVYEMRDAGSRAKSWLMRRVLDFVLRSADAVKVLNASQAAFITSRYPGKPVYRFFAFTATKPFSAQPTYDGGYFLSVGHPFHRKGIDLLIRAFRQALQVYPTTRLRIMGYCPEPELDAYRQLAGNDPRIEFVKPGWIQEVGEEMRGCVALVNAARSEAMGRVHLEAMACRKPVIATRTSGGLDCVEDGRTGLLCNVEDVDDLAAKLTWVLANSDQARRMGEQGYERLRREFSEERYVEMCQAMVTQVIGGDRLGAGEVMTTGQSSNILDRRRS
jgi:glycosyltransferase involved in cell wall biosynthesis